MIIIKQLNRRNQRNSLIVRVLGVEISSNQCVQENVKEQTVQAKNISSYL